MTPSETVVLARYVKACCPQQAIDEFTPDAWHDLLSDLSLADCREAAAGVAKRQPFVSPSEIRTEVRRIRNERIARSVIPAPPAELTDNPVAYRRALAASVKRAADGHAPPAGQRAISGGDPGQRSAQLHPTSLRAAFAGFRAALGPARGRRPSSDPQAIAAQQAEEARTQRAQREGAQPDREAS